MRRQHVLGQHEGQRHDHGQRRMGDGQRGLLQLQLGQQQEHGGILHGGKLGHVQQQRVVQHGGLQFGPFGMLGGQ